MIDKTVALILGGGVGSRLYPLTKDRSKPAVPIAGKYRLIDIPISNCINSKVNKMFVLTMFNSASLNKHVKNAYRFDNFSDGFVDIMAAEQTRDSKDWFQGTADAVRQTYARLDKIDYEHVLILSGDQLYKLDFESILAYHVKEGADVTVATIPVNAKDATGFGVMKVNKDGFVDAFVEKPSEEEVDKWKSVLPEKYTSKDKHYLASMGIYVFSKKVMRALFDENPQANDFGKEIIPYAVESSKYKVGSYPYDGYWADIGSITSFHEANLRLTGFLPEFHLYDNEDKVYTHARMLAPSKFFGTTITHGLISEGCLSHAKELSRCILGIRSRVGKNTVIRDSIIMGNDYYQTVDDMGHLEDNELLGIGNNCFIQNAILDKNVRIGHNVSIKGGEGLEDVETDEYCIRDGIVIIKKNAVIPWNSMIGVQD